MKHAADQIPPQTTGRATDFSEECRYNDIAAAHQAFKKAAKRLLLVNEWHIYAGPGSSKFGLANNLGEPATGYAEEGALICVDLPVPGSDAGDGLEWVMIERMDAVDDPKAKEEFVAMTVRPIPDPHKAEPEIAHFYEDASTSTFIVKRVGSMVSASVHGRNETPNNSDVGLHDKVRNTLVALSARIGLAGPQWKKLAKGLLDQG